MRIGLVVSLFLSGVMWLALVLFEPQAGQDKVWYKAGREYLSDYFMPRNTVTHVNPYREPAHVQAFSFRRGGDIVAREGWDVEEHDRVYPAGALLPLSWFEESLEGARFCNVFLIGAFILVVCACLSCSPRAPHPLACVPLLLSGPFLFACERGNPIWLAAAGTLFFLLFWDYPARHVRWLAAMALSIAAAVKVVPAVLGILYLGPVIFRFREEGPSSLRRSLSTPTLCVIFGAIAFVFPWFFVAGIETFPDWWRACQEHAAHYGPRTMFGFVGLYRTAMIALNGSWEGTVGFALAWWVNILCGVGALGYAVWATQRSRYASVLLATSGLLLLSVNMQPYTALYLLPAFFLWLTERPDAPRVNAWKWLFVFVECVAWFVIWTPLQLPFGTIQLYPLANVAFMVLTVLALRR